MGGRRWTRALASSSIRNDRRTAPRTCGREKWGRLTACATRSAVQYWIIRPDIQPGLRRVARPGVRPLPATSLDWRRRNGRTIGPCGVSPAEPANCQHCSPVDRRSRPAPPRSRPFPCERAAPCNRPEGDSATDSCQPAEPISPRWRCDFVGRERRACAIRRAFPTTRRRHRLGKGGTQRQELDSLPLSHHPFQKPDLWEEVACGNRGCFRGDSGCLLSAPPTGREPKTQSFRRFRYLR
jgi:hypothetical protein